MSEMELIGGWLFEQERYDELHAAAVSEPDLTRAFRLMGDAPLPKVIDPRPWSKIRMQDYEGSCQGHALSAAGEMCHKAKTGVFRQFSPDFAYYETQRRDGLLGADQGSTIAGGAWVAANKGFLPEELMPYTPAYNPRDIQQSFYPVAAQFKVAQHAMLPSLSSMAKWLAGGFGGLWWGTRWGVTPDSQGRIFNFRPGRGGHATAIMGWPLDNEWSSDGLPTWWIEKNSWSERWGLRGFALRHRNSIEQALMDQYTVVAGISDMDQLKPREVNWEEEPWIA